MNKWYLHQLNIVRNPNGPTLMRGQLLGTTLDEETGQITISPRMQDSKKIDFNHKEDELDALLDEFVMTLEALGYI